MLDETLRQGLRREIEVLQRTWQERVHRALVLHGGDTSRADGALRAVLGQGAGDVSYAIDDIVERILPEGIERLAHTLDLHVTLISEGVGERVVGPARSRPVRMIVDPIDGTRNIMFDLRPAWILTGVAEDRGEQTSIADIEVAVQTEIPLRASSSYEVLSATHGGGALRECRRLDDGTSLARAPLKTEDAPALDNAYYVFFKYSALERPRISTIEREFLERLAASHGVDLTRIYDDQYICNAGHLQLLCTGRYRFLADLRAALRDQYDPPLLTSKPYDVSTALIAREAGVCLTAPDGAEFDAPLNTSTPVGFIGYGSRDLKATLEPLLRETLRAHGLL